MAVRPRNSAIRLDITGNEIDDILDELDEQELKHEYSVNLQNIVNWTKIIKQIRNSNIELMIYLITNKGIDINAQNPDTNKTLLIYAVILSTIDMVQQLLECGADVDVYDNDNKNALCYAKEIGDYKLIELLYYQQLSPHLRTNLKDITHKIHERNKAAEMMRSFEFKARNDHIKLHSVITKYMICAIQNRYQFTDDMLYYAWYFEIHSDNKNINGYETDIDSDGSVNTFKYSLLWKAMMKAFEDIISDTTDKPGWKWLNTYFIPSLIWYLPLPSVYKDSFNVITEDTMKNTLFYELWKRVRTALKKESQLLKERVNNIEYVNAKEWNELITYNIINTKYLEEIRQDSCGCLVPKYNEKDLDNDTDFDANKYYDTTIYLNALIFRANILNTKFQTDMKDITKEICIQYGLNVQYKSGSVATLHSLQRIVDTQYINAIYPRSAALLNVNTCYLEFEYINHIIKYIKMFQIKVKHKSTGCIVDILQCKNKWNMFDADKIKYMDISLNVLVKAPNDSQTIVAEIKLCLNLMCAFKRRSDKLRCIEDVAESVYYHAMLTEDMSYFMFWGFSDTNKNTTFNRTLNDEDILNRLKCVYIEDDTAYLTQILEEDIYEMNKMQMIFVHNYIESFKFILFCTALSVKHILRLLIGNKHPKDLGISVDGHVSETAMELIKYIQNDRKPLLNLLRFSDETGKTLFMSICELSSDILNEVILENVVLSEEDWIKLLLIKDKQNKTALFYSFKNTNCDFIIHSLRDHKDILIQLLYQQTTSDGICLMQCPSTKTMRKIIDIIDDDDVISKLLSETVDSPCFCGGEKESEELLLKWNNYIKYERDIDDIDIDTFAVLCYFRKYNEIKEYLVNDKLNRLLFTQNKQTKDDEQKETNNITLDNVADVSSGEFESKNYEEMNTSSTTENDENIDPNKELNTDEQIDTDSIEENIYISQFINDARLVKLLLLNNSALSDQYKYKVLVKYKKCDIEILRYFGGDRLKLLVLFKYCDDIESLKFILDNDSLRMEDKMDILLSENRLHNAFKHGFGSDIVLHFMNDMDELNKLLFYENKHKQIAMMEIYKKENKCNDKVSLKLLLFDGFDVEKLLSHSDVNGYCLLHFLMQNIVYIECVLDVIQYYLGVYDDGAMLLMKLLSQKTEKEGDTVLMKGIKYNDQENGNTRLRYNFVNKISFECIKTLFDAVKDNNDIQNILEFLKITNNNHLTLYEMARSFRQYEIMQLIDQFKNK